MDIFLSLTALVLLMVAGTGLALLAMPVGRTTTVIEVLSLSVLFGAGFVSAASFAFGFILNGLLLKSVLALACAFIGGLGLRRSRHRRVNITVRLPGDVSAILAATVLTGLVAFLAWLAFVLPLGWDGLFVWEFKARQAFLNGGAIPLISYTDPTRTWTHPEYPLLLPLTEVWMYGWLNDPNQQMLKLLFLGFSLAAVGLLFTAGSRLAGCRWNGFLAATLFLFLPWPVLGADAALSGYADAPLGAFYLASFIYLLECLEGPDNTWRMAASLIAVLPWVKQEGAILWLSLLFVAGIGCLGRPHRLRSLIPLFAPGLLGIVAWQAFVRGLEIEVGRDFVAVTLANLRSNLPRAPDIAVRLGNELADWKTWGFLWPVFLIALVLPGSDSFRRRRLAFAAAVALPTFFYAGTFVFSRWSYLDHMNVSLARLLLHTAFTAILAIALAVPAPPTRQRS